MKKISLGNNVFLLSKETHKGRRMLDYYLKLKNGVTYYAFSRNYSRRCHQLCCGTVPVNTILHIRTYNEAVMNLQKYLKHMLPFLVEYYELAV